MRSPARYRSAAALPSTTARNREKGVCAKFNNLAWPFLGAKIAKLGRVLPKADDPQDEECATQLAARVEGQKQSYLLQRPDHSRQTIVFAPEKLVHSRSGCDICEGKKKKRKSAPHSWLPAFEEQKPESLQKDLIIVDRP